MPNKLFWRRRIVKRFGVSTNAEDPRKVFRQLNLLNQELSTNRTRFSPQYHLRHPMKNDPLIPPFLEAIERQDVSIVDFYVSWALKTRAPSDLASVARRLATAGHCQPLFRLLSSYPGFIPLSIRGAAFSGNESLVIQLIELDLTWGHNFHHLWLSFIEAALAQGHSSLVLRFLELSSSFDPSVKLEQVVELALLHQQTEIIFDLLSAYEELDPNHILYLAARSGQEVIITNLIANLPELDISFGIRGALETERVDLMARLLDLREHFFAGWHLVDLIRTESRRELKKYLQDREHLYLMALEISILENEHGMMAYLVFHSEKTVHQLIKEFDDLGKHEAAGVLSKYIL